MTKNSGTFGVVVGWVIDLLVISETETGSLNTWAQEIFPGHILGDNFVYFGSLLLPQRLESNYFQNRSQKVCGKIFKNVDSFCTIFSSSKLLQRGRGVGMNPPPPHSLCIYYTKVDTPIYRSCGVCS